MNSPLIVLACVAATFLTAGIPGATAISHSGHHQCNTQHFSFLKDKLSYPQGVHLTLLDDLCFSDGWECADLTKRARDSRLTRFRPVCWNLFMAGCLNTWNLLSCLV